MEDEPPGRREDEVPTDEGDGRGLQAPDAYRGFFSSPVGCCFLLLPIVIVLIIVIIVALKRNVGPDWGDSDYPPPGPPFSIVVLGDQRGV